MSNAYILQRNRITTKILYTARASHYEHYPLVKGNIAPSFSLNLNDRLTQTDNDYLKQKTQQLLLDDLLQEQKPLVVIFYTQGKQKAANFSFFKSLNKAVTATGGKLLILTTLQYLGVNTAESSLHIYRDKYNSIAKAFGLYDPQNPLWNWVPGVEESETFLPAFYVIAADKQILYHYVDYNFSLFNDPELLHHSFVQCLLKTVDNNIIDTLAYNPGSYKLVS